MRAEDERLIEQMFDNKRQYQIPVYQRNYDWKKNNCLTLFNDVIDAYKNSRSHFLGSIVQVQQDEDNGIKRFIIIDGQQRMTSVYLLLKALYDNVTDESTKDELTSLLFNASGSRTYGKDDKNKLKLKPIKSDNEQFLLLMSDSLDEMDKTSNIYINYEYFCELIKKQAQNDISVKNILKGLKYLAIVMISLKEPEDDPQVIFERINSTGEDLKISDLMRNYLLMTDADMENLYENYWLPIEDSIGKSKLNDYIITYLLYKLPDTNESNAYQQFKKFAATRAISHVDILVELKKLSKYYRAFVGERNGYSNEVNNLLRGFRLLKQTTIYPFLFDVFDDRENGVITEITLVETLKFFFNYTLRRAVTGVPTNSLRGLYKTLYSRIFGDGSGKTDGAYLDAIYRFMAGISQTKDVMPNNTVFKERLKYGNLYKNNALCKFVLTVLENGFSRSLKERVVIDEQITIEHVLPQNFGNAIWRAALGGAYDYVYGKYLHTLGNLTLSGYNGELSDKSFADKKAIYRTSKFAYLNSDITDKADWDEACIQARAERLSARLLEEFRLPDIFERKATAVNDTVRHTVDDGADITGKKLRNFIFLGEDVAVSGASDMLVGVCEMLYVMDQSKIETMGRENYVPQNSQVSLFSYDKTKMRAPKEIDNSGIYVETNRSANDIVRTVKKLLEEFGLSYDDFVFYVTE